MSKASKRSRCVALPAARVRRIISAAICGRQRRFSGRLGSHAATVHGRDQEELKTSPTIPTSRYLHWAVILTADPTSSWPIERCDLSPAPSARRSSARPSRRRAGSPWKSRMYRRPRGRRRRRKIGRRLRFASVLPFSRPTSATTVPTARTAAEKAPNPPLALLRLPLRQLRWNRGHLAKRSEENLSDFGRASV